MLSGEVFSQGMPANRFDNGNEQIYEQQQRVQAHDEYPQDPQPQGKGPGNPDDPVPINDYIPLLAFVAVGMLVYAVKRQRKTTL